MNSSLQLQLMQFHWNHKYKFNKHKLTDMQDTVHWKHQETICFLVFSGGIKWNIAVVKNALTETYF